jgi:3-oxoacyl-[acyl-carrier protein] reductase
MDLNLTNKTALVCGSSQGIGKAIAQAIAVQGANIILCARNEEALQAAKEDLDASKGQAHEILVADFSDPDGLKATVESFLQGREVHILVNNTGGPPGGPITEASTDEFESAFRMHLLCNHILTQLVIPGMKQAGFGRIINVISTSVKQPIKGLGVSNTTRGAVASWAKTMANELGGDNITVNNVLPGGTNTVRLSSLLEKKAERLGSTVDAVTQEWLDEIPMGRFAEPEEIASAAAFLASPAASYINGVSLPVDGGRTGSL